MKNNNIDKKIKEYFDNEIPEPNMTRFEEIAQKVSKSSYKKADRTIFWFRIVCISICLIAIIIPSILLPIFINNNKNQNNITYYTYDDAYKLELEPNEIKEYISNNYNKYSFIFDLCEIEKCYGIYVNDNNNLALIGFDASRKDIPYTIIHITLVINNFYIFEEDEFYKKDSIEKSYNKFKFYKKTVQEIFSTNVYVLLEFKDYKLYLLFDKDDNDFINKFLEI